MIFGKRHSPEAEFDPEFGGSGGRSGSPSKDALQTMQKVSKHQLIYSIVEDTGLGRATLTI